MNRIALKYGKRTPFAKMDGNFQCLNVVDLSYQLIDGILEGIDFEPFHIKHVIWGMVVPDPDIYSIAREAVLASKLPNETEAYSLSRACATSLQCIANGASYYNTFPDEESVTLVGGVESFSTVRPTFTREGAFALRKFFGKGPITKRLLSLILSGPKNLIPVPPAAREFSTGLTMGEHCELMVKEFKVGRAEQDELAFRSHKRAAQSRGAQSALLYPLEGLNKDVLIRDNTTIEKMALLKPVFDKSEKGTITAANSSPYTDGAAGMFVVSPRLEANIKPDGYLVDFEFVAVHPDLGLLMGPSKGMLTLLERNKLTWSDFDYIEIHEAFAGTVLCNVKALNDRGYCTRNFGTNYDPGYIDVELVNPWGSSIAYGHPFGATGVRIVMQGLRYLEVNQKKRGIVGICAAGALAGAAIFERA
jgi:acetyl-CoA acetyltransferase family protein